MRSPLRPIRDVAKMLKRHLGELLSYFRHRITNAAAEGFNSRIQSIKSATRGFHAFANYRTHILFYCGELDLHPDLKSHYKSRRTVCYESVDVIDAPLTNPSDKLSPRV